MASIRQTKLASGSIAVQVVRYENRRPVVLKHVGSGRTDQELASLMKCARVWIERSSGQLSLFVDDTVRTIAIEKTKLFETA